MKTFLNKHKHMLYGIAIIVGTLLLDITTKLLSNAFLPKQTAQINEPPLAVIKGFFYLVEHHNYGVAWSSFENNFVIIYMVPLLAIGLFGYFFLSVHFKEKLFYSISVSLMISGTLGNYIDRLFRGYVVDFLSFHFGSYVYPTFNIADSLLVVGVILFVVDLLFFEPKRKDTPDEALDQ